MKTDNGWQEIVPFNDAGEGEEGRNYNNNPRRILRQGTLNAVNIFQV